MAFCSSSAEIFHAGIERRLTGGGRFFVRRPYAFAAAPLTDVTLSHVFPNRLSGLFEFYGHNNSPIYGLMSAYLA
jgi:hypothetical protein